jgi:hypothetical protein
MHDMAGNHISIGWGIGVFFWLVIFVGIVIFVKSAFKANDD